jgi:hypothetical protein
VSFSLPDGSAAELALIDVAGRVVASRQVGTLGAGSHLVTLTGAKFQPGIYWLRLTRQHRALLRKVVLTR